jgi:hypothetical protein
LSAQQKSLKEHISIEKQAIIFKKLSIISTYSGDREQCFRRKPDSNSGASRTPIPVMPNGDRSDAGFVIISKRYDQVNLDNSFLIDPPFRLGAKSALSSL